MTFTALGANTDLTLTGSQGFQYIGLDNVSVEVIGSTAVPEPASIALLGELDSWPSPPVVDERIAKAGRTLAR